MSQVTIQVDGRPVQAETGQRLLWALLAAGFDIPNLCAIEGVEPPRGDCRLCWVEIAGRDKPVTSCTVPIESGMQVRTRSPAVDRLVAASFELLMSTHRLDCKACPGNKRCALQSIANARRLKLRPKRLPKIEPDLAEDLSRPDLGFNPNHCVLCGKCVHVCEHEVGRGILAFSRRGLATRVATFDDAPLAEQDCGDCTRCAEVCPVGAIFPRSRDPRSR